MNKWKDEEMKKWRNEKNEGNEKLKKWKDEEMKR